MAVSNPTIPDALSDIALLEKATETLRAVAHPIRFSIIELLRRQGPQNVKDLQESLGVQQPVVSHHLRIMRDRGVVDVERRGQNSRYALTDARYGDFLDLLRQLVTVDGDAE